MEVTKNQIDNLNAQLVISVVEGDYAEGRKRLLNSYKRRADVKGFRRGMAPMSMIEKMYGQSALLDSVNDVIAKAIDGYIKENKLNIIGEPLPSADQKEFKPEDKDFEFIFDIALYPELNFEIGTEDHIPYYNIIATDEARKDMKDNLLHQYGGLEDGEVVGEEDFIIADIEQGEKKIEGKYVSIKNVAEECLSQFIGLKVGESVDVDVVKAFTNETDRATMLNMKKEELEGMDPMWKFTMKSIKTFKSAELCQETYDKIYGEGNVKSEEEFDAKIAERLEAEYDRESKYRFLLDAKKYLLEKAQVELPAAFMKRWLIAVNEGKYTAEQIEKEFDPFLEDFKWQTVRDFLAEKYQLKVEKEDLMQEARSVAAYQFAMYGMYDVPQEHIEQYAKRMVEDEKDGRRLVDQVEERKVVDSVREKVSLDFKDVSLEEFRELMNNK